MADRIIVIGPSGRGKSHSLQFLDPKSTAIFCPEDKPLPFKGSKNHYITVRDANGKVMASEGNFFPISNMTDIRIKAGMISKNRPEIKVIAIDTLSYAMLESVSRERGSQDWERFVTFAMELLDMFNEIKTMREDLTIIVTAHDELEDDGKGSKIRQMKHPSGKFGREKITPEGLTDCVLFSNSKRIGGKNYYWFETQSDGITAAKSPEGMFPDFKIQNNMKYVIDSYRAYHHGEDLPEPMLMSDEVKKTDEEDF